MTRVFLAGATGFTGQALLNYPDAASQEFAIHLRPDSPSVEKYKSDPRATIASFDDLPTLAKAMSGCNAILSAIGTVQARFAPGVSYETVDYATTVALLKAGKSSGIEHFVLMSSIGAGKPVGAYMKWKRKAELAVIDSGMAYTIVRPSYLVGQGRRSIPLAEPAMNGVGKLFARGFMDDWRPIPIEVVVWNYIRILRDRAHQNEILSGRHLWAHWNANLG